MRTLIAFISVAISLSSARGDTPLPPPSKVTVTSPSGLIRAISDQKAGTRVEDAKSHKVLWSLPDWYRGFFISDDGRHLVTEYDGLTSFPSTSLMTWCYLRSGGKAENSAKSGSETSSRIIAFFGGQHRTTIGARFMASMRKAD